MSYLLNELLWYLLGAALLGALIGWFMRRCTCNRDLLTLRSDMQGKLDAQSKELEESKRQTINFKTQYGDIQSKYDRQSGDLMLMTSRWQTTLNKAKQLPKHQAWIKNLQAKYQSTLSERNEYENLACQYADMHTEANQKIHRLNERVTSQENYKFRLDDMVGKVGRLNDKVTSNETHMRGMYGMVTQIQNKWRSDRVRTLENSAAKADLHALKNKYNTEISQAQKQRTHDLAEQNSNFQNELQNLRARVTELEPLEAPSSDNKFNRFMDKVRLVGTSKNNVLGRTYKQLNEVKLESSEKERVFVDTCEEKDAVIGAQAASSTALQECKSKVSALEKELQASKSDLSMLREHKQTIEALKAKINTKPIPTLKPKKEAASKPKATKPAAGLNAPAKGLNIAAAKVKDDLQVVKGIGPVMERKLNDFGVYSYEQLGRLQKKDVEALATTLGSFPDRIDRDKWVSQSKKLFKKKYGQKIE